MIECMDACFALARKTIQGAKDEQLPNHQTLFFADQDDEISQAFLKKFQMQDLQDC